MNTIQAEQFANVILVLLDETFDSVHGYYLDKNTSLFETLANIKAYEASIPVGDKCATLAAQVKHVAFYLDVIEKSVRDPNYPKADWTEIWRTTNRVTPDEWMVIQDELRANYNNVINWIKSAPAFQDEDEVSGAIAILTHTAYHLGEIRQALCTIRP